MSNSLQRQTSRRGALHCRGIDLPYGERTLVMGIINVTSDSFSGDGTDGEIDRAIDLANDMVRAGADLLDVGGESTRPQARPVDLADELARVVPVIEALAHLVSIPISVDTRKSKVAEAALAAGAHIVNDVTGLQGDANVAQVARAYGAPVI
ncbi:MAG TPA: dihydropteroate synthase, partial [Chloroflexota bacterium]|nr:dihydropteroate synthase [Chloroflexota bacterium]